MSKDTLGIVLAVVVGVTGFVLYLIDKSGRNTPAISVAVLMLIFGLCLCGAYLIPWVWFGTKTEVTWKVTTICLLAIIAVSRFGIWVWPQKENPSLAASSDRASEPLAEDSKKAPVPDRTAEHKTHTPITPDTVSAVPIYPAVDFSFVPEKVDTDHGIDHVPSLLLKIGNRGRFDIEDVRLRVTEYTISLRALVMPKAERLPDDKIKITQGKDYVSIDQYRKAGEDTLAIGRIFAGHPSQAFNLAEMKPFHFIKPPNPGEPGGAGGPPLGKPAIWKYYALRFTFVDTASRERYVFYKVISDEAPYLTPLDNPNMGVIGSGESSDNFPDLMTEPKNKILAHQKNLYSEYTDQEYRSELLMRRSQ